MICALKLITPPIVEPVTVADVKLHTHIDHDVEDNLIQLWIESARKLAEDFQCRAYVAQTYTMTFDSFPDLPILIPRAPLTAVSSVKYYDYENTETSMLLTDFIIDTDSEPGRIGFAYSKTWPSVTLRPMNAVKITFTCGTGSNASTVPATVKDAIMLYCTYRNENRAAEIDSAPRQFYDLLSPQRLYV